MKLALLSDIHGNLHALDAVLADADSLGVDAYWALGDLAAIGPEPVAVLERLAALPGCSFVRGNTDRYIVTGERPSPSRADALNDPEVLDLLTRVEGSFAWTRGFVTAQGWLEWLDALPLEVRLTLPDGSHLLGVHASPGNDDGEGLHPGRSNAELEAELDGCHADIVCTGHTHQPFVRQLNGTRVVNLGCVANPLAPDLRASYVIVHADPGATRIEHRRVAYDRTAFVDAVRRSRHPESEFIISFQHGKHRGREPHSDQL